MYVPRPDAAVVGESLAHAAMFARDQVGRVRLGTDGVVVNGSYDKVNGTIDVYVGDTFSSLDPSEQAQGPLALRHVQLLTTALGHQAGPVGGERVLLIPRRSGWAAILEHGADDSPQVPAGEHHIVHYAPTADDGAPRKVVSFTKYTNDGATPADGLGGKKELAGGYHTVATTGGHTVTMDDTAKKVTITSAGGHSTTIDDVAKTIRHVTASGVTHLLEDTAKRITHDTGLGIKTIVDGAGNTISHVVASGGGVGVGSLFGSLTAGAHAAVNQTHLNSLAANTDTAILQQGISMVNMLNTVGTMTGAQKTAALALLVAGFFTSIVKPTGSSTVRIAP